MAMTSSRDHFFLECFISFCFPNQYLACILLIINRVDISYIYVKRSVPAPHFHI